MADFSVNTANRGLVKQKTIDVAKNVDSIKQKIDKAYKDIGPDGEGLWIGDSYNSFASMCSGFMPAFDALVELLNAMGEVIDTQVTGYQDELEEKLEAALK